MTRSLNSAVLEMLSALGDIPWAVDSEEEALQQITQLARQILQSEVCTLTRFDRETGALTTVACAGLDHAFGEHLLNKSLRLSSDSGGYVSDEVVKAAKVVCRYNLKQDGGGLANPAVARDYNLNSALCYPLEHDGQLLGYLNHFSSRPGPFVASEEKLLGLIAQQATIAIMRFSQVRSLERSLTGLDMLSQSLASVSTEKFLERVCTTAADLLHSQVSIVWQLDETDSKLKIKATYGAVDAEYKKLELDPRAPSVSRHLSRRGAAYLSDVTRDQPDFYLHSAEAKSRGWVSLLTAPMLAGDRLIGMLDVYTTSPRHFLPLERRFFATYADHAALSIAHYMSLKRYESVNARLGLVNTIALRMTEVHDVDTLLGALLDGALELAHCKRGCAVKLDRATGELRFVAIRGGGFAATSITVDKGITGDALRQATPILVADVRSDEWQHKYVQFWPDTRSELAVPLIIDNARIRKEHSVQVGTKRIAVLNLESPQPGAFSEEDRQSLWPLARQAAIVINRLEMERKLHDLRDIEQEIIGKQSWDEIFEIVMRGLTTYYGYDYVTISLVVPELNCIKAEYVHGLSPEASASVREKGSYALDGDDVQARVYRSGQIEVSDDADAGFDAGGNKDTHQQQMMRVYVPIINPGGNRVVAVMEAGHRRGYREAVYEQDVEILRQLADTTARALLQRDRQVLDMIIHELTSPITGIRSHASLVSNHLSTLDHRLIQRRLHDIMSDADALLVQVANLRQLVGRPSPTPDIQKIVFVRDVVVKIINQLKPRMRERELDPRAVRYNPAHIKRVVIYADRSALMQVVYNVLWNAIKYAEADVDQFRILVDVEETRGGDILVVFRDWGVGVARGLEDKVFEVGYRAPEAISKDAAGTGLGLPIARRLMREMGGDLQLTQTYKPTEFRLRLPKRLQEPPHDSTG